MQITIEICLFITFAMYARIQGVSQYGRCNRYSPDEEMDSRRCRMCLNDENESGYIYCREYNCKPNRCGDRAVKYNDDCCASCPGKCNYGGSIYIIKERFVCLDGVNDCQCYGTGLVRSTRRMFYKEDMCNTHNVTSQQQTQYK